MENKGIPEYDQFEKLLLKWVIIFAENLLQMIGLCMAWATAGLFLAMLFPYKTDIIILLFMIVFCGCFYIPFFYLKFTWIWRVIKYCIILHKGIRMNGNLDKIQETYWGKNRNLTFYFSYDYNGEHFLDKNKVGCVEIDMRILGVNHVYGKFTIPENTKIPIAVYKKKAIMIHNDCGFYDIAHYNGKKWMANFF